MSINNGMNTQMGTKWFTFYTKIRPCFAFFALVANFFNFIVSMDSYITNFVILLCFIGNIANCILCIIVAIKADKDYNSFVRFVKGLLIFEFLYYPIISGIQIYYVNVSLLSASISTAILIILLYFIWYRLNMNYFRKRIVTDDLYTDVCIMSQLIIPSMLTAILKQQCKIFLLKKKAKIVFAVCAVLKLTVKQKFVAVAAKNTLKVSIKIL